MRTTVILSFAALILAPALPAAAAEPPAATPAAQEELSQNFDNMPREAHGRGHGWRGHFRGRDGSGGRPIISLALRYRQELGLSPAQVETLERLRDDFRREAIRRGAEIRVASLDLSALTRTDLADVGKQVDMGKVETKVRELERLRAEQRLVRIRTIEAGKAQLTPEQRTKLGTLVAESQLRWRGAGTPAAIPRRF